MYDPSDKVFRSRYTSETGKGLSILTSEFEVIANNIEAQLLYYFAFEDREYTSTTIYDLSPTLTKQDLAILSRRFPVKLTERVLLNTAGRLGRPQFFYQNIWIKNDSQNKSYCGFRLRMGMSIFL